MQRIIFRGSATSTSAAPNGFLDTADGARSDEWNDPEWSAALLEWCDPEYTGSAAGKPKEPAAGTRPRW
jgi:hypothetical protein